MSANPVAASIGTAASVPGAGVVLACANDIPMVPIRWLWPGWLAQGKMHLLAGAPGQGKTTLAMAMAATVSTGGVWPDGKRCAPGRVLIWTGEDDPGDTLNPRLAGMGADLARIHYVQETRLDDGRERAFDPAADMPMLLIAAQAIGGVALLIVDPIVSAVTGDSHRNAEVRQGLQPLIDLAGELDAALVGITHLSKGSAGRDPTERVIGSIAFAAVARMVMLAAKVKDDDGADKRILVRSKSSIGVNGGGFEYSLQSVQVREDIDTSVAVWGEAISGTARELLAEAESEPDGEDGAVASAADFLRELLADGATPAKQVKADATGAGLSWITVRQAADDIGVIRKKAGMDAGWYWSLSPEGAQKKPKVLTQNDEHLQEKLSTFGDSDPALTPSVKPSDTPPPVSPPGQESTDPAIPAPSGNDGGDLFGFEPDGMGGVYL